MTLEQYSALLAFGTLGLGVLSFLALLAFLVSKQVRLALSRYSHAFYLKAMALVVLPAIVGAFIYQLVYLTPVCEMCWWQRVCMFPLAVIIPVALIFKSRGAHLMIGILSSFGMFFAAYHYYFHYQILVLGNVLSLPCSAGLLPACTESPILTWGFVTIPLMAFMGFFSVFVLSVFAHYSNQN